MALMSLSAIGSSSDCVSGQERPARTLRNALDRVESGQDLQRSHLFVWARVREALAEGHETAVDSIVAVLQPVAVGGNTLVNRVTSLRTLLRITQGHPERGQAMTDRLMDVAQATSHAEVRQFVLMCFPLLPGAQGRMAFLEAEARRDEPNTQLIAMDALVRMGSPGRAALRLLNRSRDGIHIDGLEYLVQLAENDFADPGVGPRLDPGLCGVR